MTDRRRWILVAAVLGSGIVFLDSTVVNVALPRIGRDLPRLWFGVLEGQSYVYNAYLLTLSALLIRAGASGATTILGPFVGGLLVDTISWRAAFLINVPLILIAVWATYVHVPESRNETASAHFDWIGSAIVALSVGGLAFGTIYGQQRDWQDPLGYIALAVGVPCTIALPFYMARA